MMKQVPSSLMGHQVVLAQSGLQQLLLGSGFDGSANERTRCSCDASRGR